jgi:hypothetical protein
MRSTAAKWCGTFRRVLRRYFKQSTAEALLSLIRRPTFELSSLGIESARHWKL